MTYECNVQISGETVTVNFDIDYKAHWSNFNHCYVCGEWWIEGAVDDAGEKVDFKAHDLVNQLNDEDVTRAVENWIN